MQTLREEIHQTTEPAIDAGGPRASAWLGLVSLGVVTLLAAMTALVFRRQLFEHWTFPWDFLGPHTTSPAFVAAVVSDGHIPSWSPFVASGFPSEVDPQVGVYFPGWWLLGILHVPATLRVLTTVQVFHVLFGSLGVLALARIRKLAWPWATVAAIAYLFFGGFYGESEHADITRGFSYIPWLLWALTPPADGRWLRLAALPALAWLIASGAYPGQVVSFAIAGSVYLAVALWTGNEAISRRYRLSLVFAVAASAAACAVNLIPYLAADHAHELHRVFEPTAVVRAGEAIGPADLLGLYLNNFAWTHDGTIAAWTVGIPMLMGLACVRGAALRRHLPLAICGTLALALAMTPKIGIIGRAMTYMRPLFPSRFPASDYKAIVAIAIIILAAEAWADLSLRRDTFRWRPLLVGLVLVVGALIAGSRHDQPTHHLWLVVLVIAASAALALARMPTRVLFGLLAVIVAIDGIRAVYDYRFEGHVSPWQVSAAEAAPFRARDRYVRELPMRLRTAQITRPARLPPSASLSLAPTGTNLDNTGWIAEGYHFADYDSTIERVRWESEHDPRWFGLLLEPWHGYTFPCTTVGCTAGSIRLPSPSTWRATESVRTISYGLTQIVYAVDVTKPTLMIENELAVRGWSANTPKVQAVNAGIPLRAWRLSPGHYRFATTYQTPDGRLQGIVFVAGLAAWLGCALALFRPLDGRRRQLAPARRSR